MKNRKLILALFAGVCLIQWAVLGGDVITRENIQSVGVKHLFKCEGYDPVDVFRGNYIALRFDIEDDSFVPDVYDSTGYRGGYFVTFSLDSLGYSKISTVTIGQPSTDDYLKMDAYYYPERGSRMEVPFNKYFVNEDKAEEIERQYREATRANSNVETYLEVYVHKGKFVVGELVFKP